MRQVPPSARICIGSAANRTASEDELPRFREQHGSAVIEGQKSGAGR